MNTALLVEQLRYRADGISPTRPTTAQVILNAADELERLTARVAELEACLVDVVNQLEIGSVK